MTGAVVVGVVAGIIARIAFPADAFRMVGAATSWVVSILLGLVGAIGGWLVLNVWLGVGDEGGYQVAELWGPLIGVLVVLPFTSLIIRVFEREGD